MKALIYISFDGSGYFGWQVQKNGKTVQSEINRAAREVFGYECDVVGCSRTDSGVHANMFCATLSKKGCGSLDTNMPVSRIPAALCAHLPKDIAVYDAKEACDGFHARYGVKYKEYIYKIFARKIRDPFKEGRYLHYPHTLDGKAFEKMREAAKEFAGRKDFRAFMASGSKISDTVREVFDSEVTRDGDVIEFRVSADGFLYNMVRIMVGTLIAVAEGKIEPEDIGKIIASGERKNAGITVPACGLYLNRVGYGDIMLPTLSYTDRDAVVEEIKEM